MASSLFTKHGFIHFVMAVLGTAAQIHLNEWDWAAIQDTIATKCKEL